MLNARQWIFSANSWLATILALLIGFNIGLPRPYWAMATVYIVSQPLAGAARSKGIYRAFGTLIGGSAAIALVPFLSSWPELLVGGLGLWVAFCLYISLLDRTPRSYVFLLAGYTAAIIGFSTAYKPGDVFDVAIARLEEILLGIVCATMVHSLILPRTVVPVIHDRLARLLKDADSWILDALRDADSVDRMGERRQLAVEITDIRLLSTHLPFDISFPARLSVLLRALQDRFIVLLPHVSAVHDRIRALHEFGPLPPIIESIVAQIASWIESGVAIHPEAYHDLHSDIAQASEAIAVEPSWQILLQQNLLDRLHRLVSLIHDCHVLEQSFVGNTLFPVLLEEVERSGRAALFYLDHGLAALSGLAAFLTILVCGALWLGFSWPEGPAAALIAAVFCSFFATRDDPAPAILNFLYFTLVSIPIVGLYLFAIFPMIDGFAMLVLVLSPALLAIGYLVADSKYSGQALPVALGIANGLALQETFNADYAAFVNSNLAQIVALGSAIVITRLVRSVGAEWTARRILRSGWRDLASMSRDTVPGDNAAFMTLMIDRLGLLTPRLALIKPTAEFEQTDLLNDMRIGFNINDLNRARGRLSASARQPIDLFLARLSAYFARLSSGRPAILPGDTRSALDAALRAAAQEAAPEDIHARRGLFALVGLRRSLFKDADADLGTAGAAI